jgi:uncharacterized membrane protein
MRLVTVWVNWLIACILLIAMVNTAFRNHVVASRCLLEITPFAVALYAFRARSPRWVILLALAANALAFVVGIFELSVAFHSSSAAALACLVALPCVANVWFMRALMTNKQRALPS